LAVSDGLARAAQWEQVSHEGAYTHNYPLTRQTPGQAGIVQAYISRQVSLHSHSL